MPRAWTTSRFPPMRMSLKGCSAAADGGRIYIGKRWMGTVKRAPVQKPGRCLRGRGGRGDAPVDRRQKRGLLERDVFALVVNENRAGPSWRIHPPLPGGLSEFRHLRHARRSRAEELGTRSALSTGSSDAVFPGARPCVGIRRRGYGEPSPGIAPRCTCVNFRHPRSDDAACDGSIRAWGARLAVNLSAGGKTSSAPSTSAEIVIAGVEFCGPFPTTRCVTASPKRSSTRSSARKGLFALFDR